jgi:hypothetical protein
MRRKRPAKRPTANSRNVPDTPVIWPDWLRSRRALIDKINGMLCKKGQVLREKHKGRYQIVDRLQGGAVIADYVDLSQLARKLGIALR